MSIQTGWQKILKDMAASGDRQKLQFAPLDDKFVPSFSDSEEVDDAAEEDGKKRESQSQDDGAHAAKRMKPETLETAVKGEQDEVVGSSLEEALGAEVQQCLQDGSPSPSPSFLSDNDEVRPTPTPTKKVVLLRGKGLVTLENVVQYALYKAGFYKFSVNRCVEKSLELLDFEEVTALIEQAKKHSELIAFMKQTHQCEEVPEDWIRCFASALETAGDELRFFLVWLADDSLAAMEKMERAAVNVEDEETKESIEPKESTEKTEVAKGGGNSMGAHAEAALEKAAAPSGPEVSEAASVAETKGSIEPKESIEKIEKSDAEAALEKAVAAALSGPEVVSKAANVEETKESIEPKESTEKTEAAKGGGNSTGAHAEAALDKAAVPSGPEVSEASNVAEKSTYDSEPTAPVQPDAPKETCALLENKGNDKDVHAIGVCKCRVTIQCHNESQCH